MLVAQGANIPLKVVLENGAEDKYITADLYNARTGASIVADLELVHQADGFYFLAYASMPANDVLAIFKIFESDESTPSEDTGIRGMEVFELDRLAGIETSLSTIDGKVDDIDTVVDGLTTALATVDNIVDGVGADTDQLLLDVATVQETVEGISGGSGGGGTAEPIEILIEENIITAHVEDD